MRHEGTKARRHKCRSTSRSLRANVPLWVPASRRGFTLVELVAVMVIVVILAVTAAPAINSISETRRASAANQLLRDLTVARQHAQATGSTTWFVLNIASQQWTILIEDVDNPGRVHAAPLMDPGTGRPYEQTLGSETFAGAAIGSVNLDGQAEVGFDWRGRPLNANEQPLAAQGTVSLSGGHVIRVEAETGHVTK